jgi:hypothetical protein
MDDLGKALRAESERFFAPIAAMLGAFAESHHLQIARYEHGSAAWYFHFRLRDNGQGALYVGRSGENDLLLFGSRERRDPERFRSFSRSWHGPVIARDDPRLELALTSLLKEIVELPTESLESDGKDYRFLWQNNDPAEGRAYIASLALAKID